MERETDGGLVGVRKVKSLYVRSGGQSKLIRPCIINTIRINSEVD